MKKRNQIKTEYKWDLTKLYKSDEELLHDIDFLKNKVGAVSKFKGQLGNKEKFVDFHKLNKEITLISEKVGQYVGLKHCEDLSIQKYVEIHSILNSLSTAAAVAGAFVEPELASLSDEYLLSLSNDNRLKNNAFAIREIIRNKPHTLTEVEENVIAMVGDFAGGYSDVFDNIDNVDIKFNSAKDSKGKEHKVNNSNYVLLLEKKDRTLRENAFKSLYKSFMDFGHTISTNLINSVRVDNFYSKTYKFDSSLNKSLFVNNLEFQVYDNLILNVHNNLPLLHKYFKILKKTLNVEKLNYWDIYLPLSSYNKKYNFDKIMEVIYTAMQPLGSEYVEILKRSVAERWIDVYPTVNKMSGAFCSSIYSVSPYVLLNHVGNIESLFTTAHELGHALHSFYSTKTQPIETYNYTIFLAEIASITNEILLLKYLYNLAKTKSEKLYYLDKYLKMFKSTIFRQTMFSEFEDYAHKLIENDKPISLNVLKKYYGDLNKKYHGKALTHCKEIEFECFRIPHFYRSYYVYKYATGMVCAIYIANKILANDKNMIKNYKTFLKSGGSDYPGNILLKCGIDLRKDDAYDVAFAEMKWALDEIEKIIK